MQMQSKDRIRIMKARVLMAAEMEKHRNKMMNLKENNPQSSNGLKNKKRDITGKRAKSLIPLAAAMALLSAAPALAADGWQQNTNGQWVYMQNDKKAVNQWVLWGDGSRRFVDGSGQIAVSRFITYEGERYYVKEDGTRCENEWFSIDSVPNHPLAKVNTAWYYAGADGKLLKDGWHTINGKTCYFYGGGNSPRKTFINVGDSRFYVDESGARQENGWFSLTNVNSQGVSYTNWYYAVPGGALLRGGWHNLDGKYYYFDQNGNSPRKTWVNIDETRCYVDADGVRQHGWFSISGINGNGQEYENWYFAAADGVLLRNGWADLDGNRYYFDQNGLSYRKRWYVDGAKNRYYLNENGVLQRNGWFKIANTNASTGAVTENWYYGDENGSVSRDGYYDIDGKRYYFDANGTMYKKRWLTTEKGTRQYFGEDGALYQNSWFGIDGKRSDGTEYTAWYYADEKGNMKKNGWVTVDGKEYYFNSGGNMATGWFDDDKYYLGDDGARRYGWQQIEIEDDWIDDNDGVAEHVEKNGKIGWFYFSEETGRKKESSSGISADIRIDGVTYGFDTYGILHQGWVRVKGLSPAFKGYRYYYPDSENDSFRLGELVKGTWLKVGLPDGIDGPGGEEWRYFLSSGEPVCAASGKYVVKEIAGKEYAFDMYGSARYGLIEINGEFYYFGEEDGDRARVTGKCTIEEDWTGEKAEYYFNGAGKGITGLENGYFYYKGKLQKANKNAKYEVFHVPGKGARLISSSGKVVKGKKVTDGDGCKWTVNSSGIITEYGSDYVAEIEAPEAVEYLQ